MAEQNPNPSAQNEAPTTSEFTEGVVGLFHTISGTKTKIVYTNVFTGKIHVKSGGFFFNFPWRSKPYKISLDQHKVDTMCRKTTTLGADGVSVGPSVDYDTDYFIKIVDPEKFMDVAYSTSPSQIKKNIGDILDQKIQDYIRRQVYDNIIVQSSVNFLDEIGRRVDGAFPANSLNQFLLENYGLEVSQITFKVRPPQSLIDEATKTKQAEQAARTAEQEKRRRIINAQTQAEETRITASAQAEAEKATIGAKVEVLGGTLNGDQLRDVITTESIAKSNNTKIITGMPGTGTSQSAMDMATLGEVIGAAIAERFPQSQAQTGIPQQQSSQQVQTQQQRQITPEEWAALPDTEYLSVEDSAALAQERGQQIAPGGRYHISYLSAQEKQKYQVAAEKGKSK